MRPIVVSSGPSVGRASVWLGAPIIQRQRAHSAFFWCVQLFPTRGNGLRKMNSPDAAQTRALDDTRFEAQLGSVTAAELDAITTALIRCVGRLPARVSPFQ
jgi:mRNA-degrading endonuclease toxin of MazEF toxin-antitoxin module